MRSVTVLLAAFVLVGCGKEQTRIEKRFGQEKARSRLGDLQPRSDAEEVVARWIKRNSKEPDKVEFVRWGPHRTKADVKAMFIELGRAKRWEQIKDGEFIGDATVRVIFRATTKKAEIPELLDRTITVKGASVAIFEFDDTLGTRNDDGDNWIEKWRENVRAIGPSNFGRDDDQAPDRSPQ